MAYGSIVAVGVLVLISVPLLLTIFAISSSLVMAYGSYVAISVLVLRSVLLYS